MKLNKEVEKIRHAVKSVRLKLFFTLCIVITLIILLLVLVNNSVLEKFYLYNKTKGMKNIYEEINTSYNNGIPYEKIEENLKSIAIKNNLDIIIKSNDNIIMLAVDNYRLKENSEIRLLYDMNFNQDNSKSLYKAENMNINLVKDDDINVNYIVVHADLDNGYELYMMTPTADLQESARISNNVLLAIGGAVLLISGIIASFVSRKFTAPILELNTIAQKMSNLDFSQKYQIDGTEDEINNLGKSINTMSEKLEKTIKQLTVNNTELEKDIEEKSKIDEMRKQFISDVSHELKTPIALIQGYAEGLVEDVNTDDESRKFYANVILDEANKMDRLVKQLLELMKLEYGRREFNNENFNIVELINEVIRKCNVMLEENNVAIYFNCDNAIVANADTFYVEQILTNYLTNAIKYSREINGERKIEVSAVLDKDKGKIRISVFNTGDNIEETELRRIWGRFYKIDSSRNREKGGTGIGLAFVKAIMNNYKNAYGATNKPNGVEFFFELDTGNE
ncbi:MAG: HAMP domain-containing protein [Clostridia bacterium]|nr:HAMP domain-containing protein [Clostridia bacterium]